MARLRDRVASIQGIALHLQPAQDLAIETRASRTQYQYVLQDLDGDELRLWSGRMIAALQQAPELADVASDQLDQGLQMTSMSIGRRPRGWASPCPPSTRRCTTHSASARSPP
jgi:multidrug efflux pump